MIDTVRFWKHVMLLDDSPDTCWIWTGAQRDDGRGRFFVTKRREVRAHWAAFFIQHGRWPLAEHRLIQTCSEPNCVRHWRQGGPFRKLSEQSVAAIRASRASYRSLARHYQAAIAHIWRIRHHLPPAVLTEQD